MKTNKYNYFYAIQQSTGCGWEDVSTYETNSNYILIDRKDRTVMKEDLQSYRLTGYPTRLVKRRELNE